MHNEILHDWHMHYESFNCSLIGCLEEIHGFVDVNYAIALKYGPCLGLMRGTAVSLSAKHRHLVVTSTMEAKHVYVCAAAQQAIFPRHLLNVLGMEMLKTMINSDNQAANLHTNMVINHSHAKHINVKYHFTHLGIH